MTYTKQKLTSVMATGKAAPDGFIVVAILWILGALSLLVSIYAVYVINTAASFALYDDQLRAEALVSAGIELTAYRQLTTPVQSRPTYGRFNFRLGQAKVGVEFEAEDARIDLNMAPKQLLVGLFQELGAHRDDAENYSDRIIAWRTASPQGQNSEVPILGGLRNRQRNAKLPHANELALVLDLPAGILERALSLVTVYSGRAQVNVLDAPPQVLAALPGMTGDRLNAVLAQRQAAPDNRRDLLALLKDSEPYVTTEGSNALRVKVSITFDNGRKANSEVVILIFDEGDEPFAVLSWRDDLDGLTADYRQPGQLP